MSGILCGAANIDPNIQGMAPKAELYVLNYQADFLDKTMELHQREGVVITNSSYSDGCNGGYTLGTQITRSTPYRQMNSFLETCPCWLELKESTQKPNSPPITPWD